MGLACAQPLAVEERAWWAGRARLTPHAGGCGRQVAAALLGGKGSLAQLLLRREGRLIRLTLPRTTAHATRPAAPPASPHRHAAAPADDAPATSPPRAAAHSPPPPARPWGTPQAVGTHCGLLTPGGLAAMPLPGGVVVPRSADSRPGAGMLLASADSPRIEARLPRARTPAGGAAPRAAPPPPAERGAVAADLFAARRARDDLGAIQRADASPAPPRGSTRPPVAPATARAGGAGTPAARGRGGGETPGSPPGGVLDSTPAGDGAGDAARGLHVTNLGVEKLLLEVWRRGEPGALLAVPIPPNGAFPGPADGATGDALWPLPPGRDLCFSLGLASDPRSRSRLAPSLRLARAPPAAAERLCASGAAFACRNLIAAACACAPRTPLRLPAGRPQDASSAQAARRTPARASQ